MAFALEDRPVRPLTADEVMAMVRAGILDGDERVELLHGVLTRMSPQDPPHSAPVQRLTTWLAPLLVAGSHGLRVQLPMRVPDRTSLPEPDIAVVERTSVVEHPSTALLVIEVAVSSLLTDTRIKPALYAAAGVAELWVLDVAGRRVECFTDPRADGYAARRTVEPPERLTPQAVDIEPLDLAGLLAGL